MQLTPLDHRDFHGTVTTAMRTSTRTRYVDVKSMCTVTLWDPACVKIYLDPEAAEAAKAQLHLLSSERQLLCLS